MSFVFDQRYDGLLDEQLDNWKSATAGKQQEEESSSRITSL